MYWAVIVIFILAILVWASADVGSGVYLKTLCCRHTDKPVVALTFDDGPDEKMTPRVLDVLGRYGIKATFFLTGRQVEKHPEIAKRIVEEGHMVGNHTYSHSPMFALWNRRRVMQDVYCARQIIEDAVGLRPRLFRPPFGVTNPIIGRVIRDAGMQGIGWSIRSYDTVEQMDRDSICRRVGRKLCNGGVILLHDRCKDADIVLESVVAAIKASGRETVTIDKLFEIEGYEK